MRATAASSVMSAFATRASPPACLIRTTVCCAVSTERLVLTSTRAPAAASSWQMARPIFCAPPVTKATLPVSSPIGPSSLPADLGQLRHVALAAQVGAELQQCLRAILGPAAERRVLHEFVLQL